MSVTMHDKFMKIKMPCLQGLSKANQSLAPGPTISGTTLGGEAGAHKFIMFPSDGLSHPKSHHAHALASTCCAC